jgi:23S rRNA (uracil1939-C5)-methyltransferase
LTIITQWLKPQGNALDAYCGVGAVALPLAGQVRKVMGIEAFKPAFKDAQANACLNGLGKTRFLAGLTEEVMPTLTIRFLR